ncbi:MAG: hypothetical protein WDO56_03930 [Gammaproteobacteria bacterium]
MTMHEGARAAGASAAPCDECVNRKVCASRLAACDAFSAYSNGKPVRMWRDADRTPLASIAARLVKDWQREHSR